MVRRGLYRKDQPNYKKMSSLSGRIPNDLESTCTLQAPVQTFPSLRARLSCVAPGKDVDRCVCVVGLLGYEGFWIILGSKRPIQVGARATFGSKSHISLARNQIEHISSNPCTFPCPRGFHSNRLLIFRYRKKHHERCSRYIYIYIYMHIST